MPLTFYHTKSAQGFPVKVKIINRKVIQLEFQEEIALQTYTIKSGHINSWDRLDPSTKILRINNKEVAGVLHINDEVNILLLEEYLKHNPIRNSRKYLVPTVVIGGFLVLILAVVFAFYWALPKVVNRIATNMPIAVEKKLGEPLFNYNTNNEFKGGPLELSLQSFANQIFSHNYYPIQIGISNSNEINAFALPGGYIVINKGLLKSITSYEELSALLAHEFIHIRNHHSTQSIITSLGWSVIPGLFIGDYSTATTAIVENMSRLNSLSHSRELEEEADSEGIEYLQGNKINPKGFIELFQHLESAGSNQGLTIFSTHPALEDRLNKASIALENDKFPYQNYKVLQKEFKKIKAQLDEDGY